MHITACVLKASLWWFSYHGLFPQVSKLVLSKVICVSFDEEWTGPEDQSRGEHQASTFRLRVYHLVGRQRQHSWFVFRHPLWLKQNKVTIVPQPPVLLESFNITKGYCKPYLGAGGGGAEILWSIRSDSNSPECIGCSFILTLVTTWSHQTWDSVLDLFQGAGRCWGLKLQPFSN